MKAVTALVISAMFLTGLCSVSFAECQGDHGKTAEQKAPAAAAAPKKASGQPAKPTTVVVGAPGHDVTVNAPASESVSAIGGAGTPGKAGGRSQ